MSGLDPKQLLDLAVRPALTMMGDRFMGPAAEQLVMGTAAVESGLVWLRQHGNGPALSLWQIEPSTFFDLKLRLTGFLRASMMALSAREMAEADETAWNLRLGAAVCRLKYRDDPHPLPKAGDIHGMAATWKRCYNSRLGAGKPDDFVRAWGNLIAPQQGRMWP